MANHIFKQVEQSVVDLSAYPVLTEEIGYPPSPVSRPGTGVQAPSGGGAGQGLGQVVARAVSDVLGWKANAADPKGFIGALTQSFSLTEVEGHVQSNWNARSYTVQTDLAGGITGAQASLYTRARDAQDQCLRLLDGLYPLNPDADPEYVKALREMAKSQIAEIVKQFAVVPPSILRVDTYFHILLGAHKGEHFSEEPRVESNPDEIGGTLGALRNEYGIWFERFHRPNPFSNSVEDEEDITNFRVISDYMTSLLQSWRANGKFFRLTGDAPAFLGTQLILMSRQFNVIAETVNEVRFTLDSVFIGPNERQQLLLEFDHPHHPQLPHPLQLPHHRHLPAMFLEDVLREIDGFVTDEGPRLIRDGGRIAINNNVIPVGETLLDMVQAAKHPKNLGSLPDGFRAPRVQNSLDDLRDQIQQLLVLARQVQLPLRRLRQIEIEG